MSEDINVTDGTVLETLNNKVDLDGGNYVGSPLEEYIHEHCGGDFNNKITNCITEIPQRIKLELADGTLTLKAGSKVIVPNGAGVFEEKEIPADRQLSTGFGNGSQTICVNATDLSLQARSTNNCVSGAGATTTAGLAYDTTANTVGFYSSSGSLQNLASFPIAIVNVVDGVITSIDQVFNGMGYIGSTAWVDKGVKVLIPEGRNTDGTLNNVELVTTKVTTRTITYAYDEYLILRQDGLLTEASKANCFIQEETPNITQGIWQRWFNIRENYWYYHDNTQTTWIKTDILTNKFAIISSNIRGTNGTITSFQPKLPFRAVDWNDVNPSKIDGQWVKKTISLLVDGEATGGSTVEDGAYSATFDLSSYLPNDGHDYMVTVRIYSLNGNVTNAYCNFLLDGGYGLMAIGKVYGKQVYQDQSIIVPINYKHQLYITNIPSYGTSTKVNILVDNYRRVGISN